MSGTCPPSCHTLGGKTHERPQLEATARLPDTVAWKPQLPVGRVGLEEALWGWSQWPEDQGPSHQGFWWVPRDTCLSPLSTHNCREFSLYMQSHMMFSTLNPGEKSDACICTEAPGRGSLQITGKTKEATTLGSNSQPTPCSRSLIAVSLSSSPHLPLLPASTSWPKEPSRSLGGLGIRGPPDGAGEIREDQRGPRGYGLLTSLPTPGRCWAPHTLPPRPTPVL